MTLVGTGEKEPLGLSRAIMLAVDVVSRPFSLRLIPERSIVFSRLRLSHQGTRVTINRGLIAQLTLLA